MRWSWIKRVALRPMKMAPDCTKLASRDPKLPFDKFEAHAPNPQNCIPRHPILFLVRESATAGVRQ